MRGDLPKDITPSRLNSDEENSCGSARTENKDDDKVKTIVSTISFIK